MSKIRKGNNKKEKSAIYDFFKRKKYIIKE
jgi:hypothetical protein